MHATDGPAVRRAAVRAAIIGRLRATGVLAAVLVLAAAAIVVRSFDPDGSDAGVRVRRSDAAPAPTAADGTPVDTTDPAGPVGPVTPGPGTSDPATSDPVPPVATTPVPAASVPAGPVDQGDPDDPAGPVTPDPADPDAALVDPNLFVDLLPDLATAPAPDWVHQGTRLSYYAAAASVPGSYHEYVEDEDGAWVDPTTGDRYREVDIPGAAGHGFNQVTVTALTRTVAVLSVRAYGLTDLALDSSVSTLGWGGAVGLPGAGADYWMHPAVLATVEETVTAELKVLRMPYTVGTTTYDTLWVQSIGAAGNITWVYDLATGMLVHTASATAGPPITGPVPAGAGTEGSTFLTQSTLVDVRQTTLPWAAEAPPAWLGTVDRIDYTGTVTVGALDAPTAVIDAWLTVDRLDSGSVWGRYRFSQTLATDVTPSVTQAIERIDGPAQVGAIWVPPAGLAALVAGQVLDEDPVTSTTVAVEWTDGVTVTIDERGPREIAVLDYDVASGLLIGSTTTDLHLATTVSYRMTSWS